MSRVLMLVCALLNSKILISETEKGFRYDPPRYTPYLVAHLLSSATLTRAFFLAPSPCPGLFTGPTEALPTAMF